MNNKTLNNIKSLFRHSRRTSGTSGFSLVELMVSVGIMSVTLLLVLAVFVGSTKASQKSVDLTAGVVVAESVLTKEVYNIINDSAYESIKQNLIKGTGTVASGVKNLNNTTFIWELSSTKVIDDTAAGADTNPFGVNNNLLKLDANVWWYKTGTEAGFTDTSYGQVAPEVEKKDAVDGISKGGKTKLDRNNKMRQGYGALHCEMSRLYNESANF